MPPSTLINRLWLCHDLLRLTDSFNQDRKSLKKTEKNWKPNIGEKLVFFSKKEVFFIFYFKKCQKNHVSKTNPGNFVPYKF